MLTINIFWFFTFKKATNSPRKLPLHKQAYAFPSWSIANNIRKFMNVITEEIHHFLLLIEVFPPTYLNKGDDIQVINHYILCFIA